MNRKTTKSSSRYSSQSSWLTVGWYEHLFEAGPNGSIGKIFFDFHAADQAALVLDLEAAAPRRLARPANSGRKHGGIRALRPLAPPLLRRPA